MEALMNPLGFNLAEQLEADAGVDWQEKGSGRMLLGLGAGLLQSASTGYHTEYQG
jgi:hypothetical protein